MVRSRVNSLWLAVIDLVGGAATVVSLVGNRQGDIEARYSTNKGKPPPDMIEDMREQYKACEPFLGTTSKLEESAVVKEAQIEALKSIAKNLLGIDLLDVKVAKERDLEKELTPTEEFQTYENEIRKLSINPQELREFRSWKVT